MINPTIRKIPACLVYEELDDVAMNKNGRKFARFYS